MKDEMAAWRMHAGSRMLRHVAASVLATALALMLVIAIVSPRAAAQSGGGYDLTWSTIDGGGATFSTEAPTRSAARSGKRTLVR